MQVASVSGIDQPLLNYTSKEYSQQLVVKDEYTELNPVVFIGIFNFSFSNGDYLSHRAICNVQTGEQVIKDMNFYFIELPKFTKRFVAVDLSALHLFLFLFRRLYTL